MIGRRRWRWRRWRWWLEERPHVNREEIGAMAAPDGDHLEQAAAGNAHLHREQTIRLFDFALKKLGNKCS